MLIGPGRWGSSDPWLGVPVKWPAISAARLIVEAGLTNYRRRSVAGHALFPKSHLLRRGLLHNQRYIGDGLYQRGALDAQPAVYESDFVRHVRFDRPLSLKIDGRKKLGFLLLPEAE